MKRRLVLAAVLIVAVIALAAAVASLQRPVPAGSSSSTPTSSSSSHASSTSTVLASGGRIVVGMEYAQPGLASEFSKLGISGVKYLPASFSWDKMQSSSTSPIDFTPMDAFVREYQDAGFNQLVVGLKSQSRWASVDFNDNPTPKPEYRGAFQAWVSAVVERYDYDGKDDMSGLRFPVRYYEAGVEFSTYEPEPAGDYILMLSLAYGAAHGAYDGVVVLNSAFLVTTAFDGDPSPDQYPAAFAAVDHRIMYHSLADILQVLDRPDIFDAVDFHALGDAYEIYATVNWLNYEMGQRGYAKPIVIGDTVPSPLASWGAATVCDKPASQMAIIIQPAQESDRCRLAAFFSRLISGNQSDLAWTRAFIAADMVEKVVIAAERNVTLIDTSFMEDIPVLMSPFLQAGAGLSAWGGMARTSVNFFTQAHSVEELRPSFYAMKQLAGHMSGYSSFVRVPAGDTSVFVYKLVRDGRPLWIAWYQPPGLFLTGDGAPSKTVQLSVGSGTFQVESLITQMGEIEPNVTMSATAGGVLTVVLGQTPVFVYSG